MIIIGDLSLGTAEQTNELLTRLNGRLYLITGNHDRFVRQTEFHTSRFTWIKPYEELSDNKRKVVLCHYQIMCYNGQYRLDEEGNPKTYMLYGHVHDTQDQRLLEQSREITRNTKTINASGEEQSIEAIDKVLSDVKESVTVSNGMMQEVGDVNRELVSVYEFKDKVVDMIAESEEKSRQALEKTQSISDSINEQGVSLQSANGILKELLILSGQLQSEKIIMGK